MEALNITEAQAARLAEIYPRLSLASAYELWQVRKEARTAAEARHDEAKLLLDFEGEASAGDLFRTGYFDVVYEEWVPGECEGPMPRWVEETTLCNEVTVSPDSLARAIFCLIAGVTIPQILKGALRNASIQLHEAKRVADGFRDVRTMYDGTDDRDMGDDVMPWLHRDPSNKSILSRWNRPDDELEFMEQLREQGRESEWTELMTEFRRQKVHTLLQSYFGLTDYTAETIVLKWEQTDRGWRPAKQMNAVEWVNWSIEQSGSILGGLQSVSLSLQKKIALRKRKQSNSKAAAKA